MNKKLGQLFWTFLKIGAFTFGGGYAMIALLENEFIARRGWLEQDEFLDMVAIAESTPGPVAINSATYIGYRMGRRLPPSCPALPAWLPSPRARPSCLTRCTAPRFPGAGSGR